MIQLPNTILLPIILIGIALVIIVKSMGKSLTSASTKSIPLSDKEARQMREFEMHSHNNVISTGWRTADRYILIIKNEATDDTKTVSARTIPELQAKAQIWCKEIAEKEKRMAAEKDKQ